MTNHNFLIENICQREVAEKLRKRFVNTNIFILSLNLSFESIYVVHLFRFMIASSHMEEVFISTFPSYKCKNTLYWKRSSINEISIEKVLILNGWITIKFEDIVEIIVLTMDISTNCYLFIIIYRVVN